VLDAAALCQCFEELFYVEQAEKVFANLTGPQIKTKKVNNAKKEVC